MCRHSKEEEEMVEWLSENEREEAMLIDELKKQKPTCLSGDEVALFYVISST